MKALRSACDWILAVALAALFLFLLLGFALAKGAKRADTNPNRKPPGE